MTEKYELSRRKALIGLGTIGVAGAGAGMGTSALFSDEESFDQNTIEAGTLDMAVTGEIVAQNGEYPVDLTGNAVTADGDAVEAKFVVGDMKPGDWFILCMTVDSVADNPFYVTLHGDTLEERQGVNTEPESQVDANLTAPDPADEDGSGDWVPITAADDNVDPDLGEKLLVSYWEQWGGSGLEDLENLDNITNAASPEFYGDVSGETGVRGDLPGSGDPDEDGEVASSSGSNGATDYPKVEYTNVREFYYGDPTTSGGNNDPLGNGFASGDGILVGGTGNTTIVGSDNTTYTNNTRRLTNPDSDDDGELVFYLAFELPEEVENEIQGDGVRGNLRINAEQVRNNDDPRSGTS